MMNDQRLGWLEYITLRTRTNPHPRRRPVMKSVVL